VSGAIELHHAVTGEGPWVTLAHSLAADMSLLETQAKLLARHFRVLQLDLRGHGGSKVAPPYSMAALAGDVQALFDRHGVRETAWVGISLGGMVGLTHALAHPGVITRMVLADTTAGYPQAAHAGWRERIAAVRQKGMGAVVEGTIGRWFTAGFAAREPATVERFRAMIGGTAPDGFIGCCEAIIDYDVHARLSEIAVPTLVLVGADDQATTPDMAKAIANGIPGARRQVIEAAAHISNIEQPAIFNAAMEQFLAA
jgi:3-oxoadipate enol-lactonase